VIDQRLQDILQDVLGEDVTLTLETRASDVPGWDSLAHINIMFAVENEFGVNSTDEELTQFANLGQLQDFLNGHAISDLNGA